MRRARNLTVLGATLLALGGCSTTPAAQSRASSVAKALNRPTTMPAPQARHVVPASVGLELMREDRSHHGLVVRREVSRRHLAFGTIVATSPTTGSPPDGAVFVTVSVRPEPACHSSQLAAYVEDGGAGAGTSFGAVIVQDTSGQPCTLTGPVEIDALAADGVQLASIDVSVRAEGKSSGRSKDSQEVVLGPVADGTAPRRQDVLVAHAMLSSTNYAGNCEHSHALPALWRIGLPPPLDDGGSLTRIQPRISGRNDVLIVCNGRIHAGPFTLPGVFDIGPTT